MNQPNAYYSSTDPFVVIRNYRNESIKPKRKRSSYAEERMSPLKNQQREMFAPQTEVNAEMSLESVLQNLCEGWCDLAQGENLPSSSWLSCPQERLEQGIPLHFDQRPPGLNFKKQSTHDPCFGEIDKNLPNLHHLSAQDWMEE